MKTKTLKNRLEKRYTGSKNTKAYQIVCDLVNGTNNTRMTNGLTIRPCSTSGSGRFTTNLDYTRDVQYLLTLLGVKFVAGNDAPKGGLTGNYIILKNLEL